MKRAPFALAIAFMFSIAAHAQIMPQATGPGIPGGVRVGGILSYDLRFAQNASFGGGLGDWETATASGDLRYSNGSHRRPFSLGYSAGYTIPESGPDYGTGIFQVVTLSQGFTKEKWNFGFNDSMSFLPEAPTTGFEGVADSSSGSGSSAPAPPPDQTILTTSGEVIDNNAGAQATYKFNKKMSLNAGVNFSEFRSIGAVGFNSDGMSIHAGFNDRISARNSTGASYSFSHFSFPGTGVYFDSNGISGTISHTFNKRLSVSGSVGPSFIVTNANENVNPGGAVTASSTGTTTSKAAYNAAASVSYTARKTGYHVSYDHGTSDGAGFLLGAQFDTVDAGASRRVGQKGNAGLSFGYRRTSDLLATGGQSYSGIFGGAQYSRKLTESVSAFVGYTVTTQTTQNVSNPASSNILSGLFQSISAGIGFSPKPKSFGR
jgi:hypothetical protein